ncbi:MAG: transketolase [Alphaproteobacteria bacterium]|nr:transketolase [Alphaproteobacteria bacterium]
MPSMKDLANAVRFLSADMVQRANSGHPGAPLGMADIVTVLWTKFLKFNPAQPKWPNRDRFVLSGGHASAMLYSLLYLSGYADITIEDIKNFRQIDSKTAGHPEYGVLAGIEATTGPLGQGLAMGIGMAISEKMAKARLGKDLIDHKIYITCGDGDLMEGISEEAISFAGHLKLNNLIVLWDNNGITIDGKTGLATSTNQLARFEANGWQVLTTDGHDANALENILMEAQKSEKPVLIACKTTIGYGAPTKAGTPKVHGSPLGEEELNGLRKALNWDSQPFEIPTDILSAWRQAGTRGKALCDEWQQKAASNPFYAKMQKMLSGKLPDNFDADFQKYKDSLLVEKPSIASRKSSQNTLEKAVALIPNLIGGSADLTASNLTNTSNSKVITSDDFSGNYIEYGIREHAMGAIMNGIALHGFFKPYGGTFFVFADYLKPAMRLSALMNLPVTYVLTHDSIGVGEDGPTHQPIEQLAMLRTIPNLCTIRPADALECAEAWQIALHNNCPTALILSRQNLPFERTSANENLTAKGAYVISNAKSNRMATLIATGSEVSLAIEAQKQLWERGVDCAVVSLPSWDLFEKQSDEYRQSVLGNAPRVSLEAATPFGWERYASLNLGISHFGASGPAQKVYEKAGLTVQNVVQAVSDAISG